MNCITHPDIPAVAYCRTCGKALCPSCERPAQGTTYCSEHSPLVARASASAAIPADLYSPYNAPPGAPTGPPPQSGASPGLAFLLGLIPGVGAIYNGQYVKGLVHVIVLGVLISAISSGAVGGMEPLFGMLIAAWIFYMAFEAYHTARRRQTGQSVDEFSSIVPLHGGRRSSFPVGPLALIVIGTLFLLNTLDIIRFSQLLHYWPVALIAAGAYMLYERITPSGGPASQATDIYPEGGHERRL